MDRITTHEVRLEADHLNARVRRVFDAAADHAEHLGHAATAVYETAIADSYSDSGADELAARASALRGHAVNALLAAVGLAVEAGALESLADVRRSDVARDADDEDDDGC